MPVRSIETPVGEARVAFAAADRPLLTLVLGHGAGGGIEAADLEALARELPSRGVTVLRVQQPWRVAGRKVAAAPATLDRAWLAVLEALGTVGPLAVGGRSAGARVACRTARAVGAARVVALAFPLHPPGRPERTRLAELLDVGAPTLVVQGTRDAFGGPSDFPSGPDLHVHPVPGADHAFRVPRTYDREATLKDLVSAVGDWLLTPADRGI